jgi:GT2 family glycosyltransferase
MLSPRLIAGSHPPAEYDADIIILMHNRLAETMAATASALRQQNISLHVSVLDQGSSEEARAAFIAAFRHSPHFGYYAAEKNLGVGGGRNFLSGLGAGACIVALDNDAVFADALVVSRAYALLRQSPKLGAIAFRILARDGIHLDEFSWGYPQGLKHAAHENFAATTFVGAGHAIRRTAWTQAGGYDADLFFTWEEYDFSLRAIALGWSILHAGSLAVIHNVSPEARISWHSERMRLFVRNRLIIARKWNIPWLRLLPRIVGYLLKAKRNRHLRPALSGMFEAISADHRLFRRTMNRHMRHYIHINEGRFRGHPIRSFYRHVILEMQEDEGSASSVKNPQATRARESA